jgi:hypothetical protein
MSPRVARAIPFLLLGTTACGDATITATSTFPRQGEDNRGATVRVVAEEAPQRSEPEIGH